MSLFSLGDGRLESPCKGDEFPPQSGHVASGWVLFTLLRVQVSRPVTVELGVAGEGCHLVGLKVGRCQGPVSVGLGVESSDIVGCGLGAVRGRLRWFSYKKGPLRSSKIWRFQTYSLSSATQVDHRGPRLGGTENECPHRFGRRTVSSGGGDCT